MGGVNQQAYVEVCHMGGGECSSLLLWRGGGDVLNMYHYGGGRDSLNWSNYLCMGEEGEAWRRYGGSLVYVSYGHVEDNMGGGEHICLHGPVYVVMGRAWEEHSSSSRSNIAQRLWRKEAPLAWGSQRREVPLLPQMEEERRRNLRPYQRRAQAAARLPHMRGGGSGRLASMCLLGEALNTQVREGGGNSNITANLMEQRRRRRKVLCLPLEGKN